MTAMTVFPCLLLVSLYYLLTISQAQAQKVHGSDCSDIERTYTFSASGIYRIQPKGAAFSFQVFCEMAENGGLTFIQRHDGTDGLNFEQDWNEYENGFGNLEGEHWLGLKYMRVLTHQTDRPSTLYFSIGSFDGQEAYAEYSPFSIGNASTSYKLAAGNYSGTAGDGFRGDAEVIGSNENGSPFSTRDHAPANCDHCQVEDKIFPSCAALFRSGWWFNDCGSANLNSPWLIPNGFVSSGAWPTWRLGESLKFSRMYLIHS